MKKKFENCTLDTISTIAKEIILFGKDTPVWLFEGEMGAGKTTTIKAVCKALGIMSPVSSPTFSIVNEYTTKGNEKIYHFDFYRIKNEHESLDFGVEEYLESGNYCLLEWASKIENLLPLQLIKIHIMATSETEREYILEKYG